MNAAFLLSQINTQRLAWAIGISVCLHIAIAIWLPQWQFHKSKQMPPPIEVALTKPVEPVPLPEPVQPQPIPKPKAQPKPKKKALAPPPPPVPQELISAPPVIAVNPTKPSVKPPEVVVPPPPPEPPVQTEPNNGEIEAAKNAFKTAAHRELRRNQRYPRIAVERGLEGDVMLEISLDKEGNVTQVQVIQSSNSSALDNAAIKAAKDSNLKQYLHGLLKGKIDSISVTVSFKLS